MLKLKTMVGDHPTTMPLRQGRVAIPGIELEIADVQRASGAFKRVIRDMEFDVAEMAIITFLIAKAYNKPLALLPAVGAARYQHQFLAYNAERGPLQPGELAGKKVGIRSYPLTTGTWLRGILAHDYGVDLDKVEWVTVDDPHVAEYQDPPNVTRAPKGSDMATMLRNGELDAAILGEGLPKEDWCRTLIKDPAAAAKDWAERNDAIQINHLVVVKESLLQDNPEAVREVYKAFAESQRIAVASGAKPFPFGVEANRRNLDIAIEYAFEQRLIPTRFTVDELFTDVTRSFD